MHVGFLLDKTISVPQGKVVRTGYVKVHKVRLGCTDPMSMGDVREKYELVKQQRGNAIFPPPIGHWEEDTFVIVDGRHLYVAYLMNGYTDILVGWLD